MERLRVANADGARINDDICRLSVHDRVGAVAHVQYGVAGLDQLRELGLAPRRLQHRVEAGTLYRIHHGVYSLSPPGLLSQKGLWMGAVLACGHTAVLSHRSAAALHELRATSRRAIDVTVPGRGSRKRSTLDIHRSITLTADDITTVEGIPVTTVTRTLLDLAEVIPKRSLERAVDQAEVLERLDVASLLEHVNRNRPRRGVWKLKAILATRTAPAPTWSELEERFLALVRKARLPVPDVNAWVDPDDGEPALRVDFLWRAPRLVIETDGHASHRTFEAFERDRRRDQRLTLAGWRAVRVTWRQLAEDPAGTAGLVAGLLAASA